MRRTCVGRRGRRRRAGRRRHPERLVGVPGRRDDHRGAEVGAVLAYVSAPQREAEDGAAVARLLFQQKWEAVSARLEIHI